MLSLTPLVKSRCLPLLLGKAFAGSAQETALSQDIMKLFFIASNEHVTLPFTYVTICLLSATLII